MFQGFGWPHLLIILLVVIVLFGAKRLPDAARGVGQSLRIFKSEAKAMRDDGTSGEQQGSQQQQQNSPPQGQLPQSGTSSQNGSATGSSDSSTPQPGPRQNDIQA
jgi:sec-independent protein translocase protein TatA